MKPVDPRIGPALVVPVASAPFTGYVEVTGGVITHLGPGPTEAAAATTAPAASRIVIPGLVNTHCHTSQQLGRGLGDDVDLLTWLHDRIWPYELALTESDAELSALVCAIEQIRNGVTLIADPGGRHVDGMARGLAAAGIRALLGRSAMDSGDGRPPGDRESTDEVLTAQDELVGRWHGRDRMRFSYTLRDVAGGDRAEGPAPRPHRAARRGGPANGHRGRRPGTGAGRRGRHPGGWDGRRPGGDRPAHGELRHRRRPAVRRRAGLAIS